ncbi:MAG: hypothetical protein IT384_11345 [Deltaproteobacteria bacterium]|nr:hypothetical protein [Deltaproteobacteria bacterium]
MRVHSSPGVLALALASLAAQSCKNEAVGVVGPDGTIRGLVALTIEPAQARLVTDGVTPSSQDFVVRAQLEGGSSADVTDKVTLTLSDPSVGRLSGGRFTTGLSGGHTELRATSGDKTATAVIDVLLERTVRVPPGQGQPALPADPGAVFGGATEQPSRAPSLVYPNDGVLLPPNLRHVELHYRRGSSANQLFEIRFEGSATAVLVYTRCTPLGDGCLYEPELSLWTSIAETYRGAGALKVKIRGTDDQGQAFGTSNEISVELAATPVQGGLYYWTTSRTAIMRVDFNAADPTPSQFFPLNGEGGCYGCHALSPNGRRMTVSKDGQNAAPLSLVDVAGPSVVFRDRADRREQFQSWNPTSTQFAAIYGDNNAPRDYQRTAIRIRDGLTGDVVDSVDVGDEPTHPDWSPVGNRIVFTRSTMPDTTNQRPGRGGLSFIEKSPTGSWNGPQALIEPADGKNRYYPAYSPDGQFIVYNESICTNGNYNSECDGDADHVAKLWAIPANGGTPILLAGANTPGLEDRGENDLTNTFPKWAPFVDPRWRDGSGRVMWMTFSSRRQYGLRSPNGSGQLLWMVAVDPEKVRSGVDGSYPAFALPFQDLTTSNHIAQWAAQIIPPVGDRDGGVPSGHDGGDGGLDPGGNGQCLTAGDVCDPDQIQCCSGMVCGDQGGGVFRCRFDL